jgi:hypothetical protein
MSKSLGTNVASDAILLAQTGRQPLLYPGRLNAGPPRTSKPDPGKRSRPFWDDITPHLYAPSHLQKRTLTGPVKVRNEWVVSGQYKKSLTDEFIRHLELTAKADRLRAVKTQRDRTITRESRLP